LLMATSCIRRPILHSLFDEDNQTQVINVCHGFLAGPRTGE
jgi:hypothetical protein